MSRADELREKIAKLKQWKTRCAAKAMSLEIIDPQRCALYDEFAETAEKEADALYDELREGRGRRRVSISPRIHFRRELWEAGMSNINDLKALVEVVRRSFKEAEAEI